jgi:TorA maturation chaperone TorD
VTVKCGDCAFIPGTEASNSPTTLVVAHLCALTGELFYCHLTGGPCAGWVEAVKARKVSPLKPSETQLSVAAASKELMHHAERLALAEQNAADTAHLGGAAL